MRNFTSKDKTETELVLLAVDLKGNLTISEINIHLTCVSQYW